MKNLILGTSLLMIMAVSTNTFAAPKSNKGEKEKTEKRADWGKNDAMKKDQGKSASCHHHHKKGCHKK